MKKEAPFTEDEIASLNEYQDSGYMHPFTCVCGGHTNLVATKDGWICNKCAYKQNWCHNFMANWGWKELMLQDPLYNLAHYGGGKRDHVVGGYSNATAGKFDS